MESWVKVVWRLKGNVSFALLNQDLFLLEFDFPDEAMWVLENGRRCFRGDFFVIGMVESFSWMRKKEESGQGTLDKGGRPPFAPMD